MPIYEFECKDCGELFERLIRSHNLREQLKCPGCASFNVSKKFSVFGLAVKGKEVSSGVSSKNCSSCSSTSCSTCR